MEWIKLNDDDHGCFPVDKMDLSKTEILFDNGETCMYLEDWPFANATHYRFNEELKGK
jgi:hypothetical protein